MKPEKNAKKILMYTQSMAKMAEFKVSEDDQKRIIENYSSDPEELFILVIGILGQVSREIIEHRDNLVDYVIPEKDILFCANFFDSYKIAGRLEALSEYNLLVGSAAYYLANLPGSSSVLSNALQSSSLDAGKLDILLLALLKNVLDVDCDDSLYKDEINLFMSFYKEYFETGNGNSQAIEKCSYLYKKIIEIGSPREVFLGELIFAICIKKINFSSWRLLPLFSGLNIDLWRNIIKRESFIKELWPAQILLGQNNVYKGASAVIQMPTSAGKTKSTELIIRSSFLSNRTNIAIVVAPFKALCHEIRNDYLKCFQDDADIFVDEITDAFEKDFSNITAENEKHIAVLTPEKLYYLLTQNVNFVENVGLVIYDEAHQFDSNERGVTYELLLTKMKILLKNNVQFILISAVIQNAEDISNWIGEKCDVVSGIDMSPTQRFVAFVKMFSSSGQLQYIENNSVFAETFFVPKIITVNEGNNNFFKKKKDGNYDTGLIALYLALKFSPKSSVAVFCGRKASLRKLLKEGIKYYDSNKMVSNPFFEDAEKTKISNLVKVNFGTSSVSFKACEYGIFPHCADVSQGMKLAIETAAHKSKINCIICTSTLAQGVNLPIKYLFVPSIRNGAEEIRVREFHNLIGRVARAGKLTEGSIIFTDPRIGVQSEAKIRKKVNDLLQAKKSDDCLSLLFDLLKLNLFRYDDGDKITDSIPFIMENFLPHLHDPSFIDRVWEDVEKRPEYKYNKKEDILYQLEMKKLYLEKLENFLMMSSDDLSIENVDELAKKTLAYHLANEKQKESILYVFRFLSEKLKKNEQNISKFQLYAKTLRGLDSSIELDNFVKVNKEAFLESSDCFTFVHILSSLIFSGRIKCNAFNKYTNKEKMSNAIDLWLQGKSFNEIFNVLKEEKVGKSNYYEEMGVDIFERGFGYEVSVLVNAITELLMNEIGENPDQFLKMQLFQKQIKYGLPTKESIYVYELGFCDRVIAQELAQFIQGSSTKSAAKVGLIAHELEVLSVLSFYPSYFEELYKRMLN